jgi:hypothetical protein
MVPVNGARPHFLYSGGLDINGARPHFLYEKNPRIGARPHFLYYSGGLDKSSPYNIRMQV